MRMRSEQDVGLLALTSKVLEEKLKEAKSQLMYALADLDNLRRRQEIEIESKALAMEAKAFLPLLTAVDDLQRVWQQVSDQNLKEGLGMVLEEFRSALKQAGVEEIPGVGSKFDPMLHEAIGEEASELPPGTVAVELRKGYTIRGHVLRPSIVKVSKKG